MAHSSSVSVAVAKDPPLLYLSLGCVYLFSNITTTQSLLNHKQANKQTAKSSQTAQNLSLGTYQIKEDVTNRWHKRSVETIHTVHRMGNKVCIFSVHSNNVIVQDKTKWPCPVSERLAKQKFPAQGLSS